MAVSLLWGADPPAGAANIVHRYIGVLRLPQAEEVRGRRAAFNGRRS